MKPASGSRSCVPHRLMLDNDLRLALMILLYSDARSIRTVSAT